MHSFLLTVLCLTLVSFSNARIANPFRRNEQRDAVAQAEDGSMSSWFSRVLKRTGIETRQNGACFNDEFYRIAANETSGEAFCRFFYPYSEVTSVVDEYPTMYACVLLGPSSSN